MLRASARNIFGSDGKASLWSSVSDMLKKHSCSQLAASDFFLDEADAMLAEFNEFENPGVPESRAFVSEFKLVMELALEWSAGVRTREEMRALRTSMLRVVVEGELLVLRAAHSVGSPMSPHLPASPESDIKSELSKLLSKPSPLSIKDLRHFRSPGRSPHSKAPTPPPMPFPADSPYTISSKKASMMKSDAQDGRRDSPYTTGKKKMDKSDDYQDEAETIAGIRKNLSFAFDFSSEEESRESEVDENEAAMDLSEEGDLGKGSGKEGLGEDEKEREDRKQQGESPTEEETRSEEEKPKKYAELESSQTLDASDDREGENEAEEEVEEVQDLQRNGEHVEDVQEDDGVSAKGGDFDSEQDRRSLDVIIGRFLNEGKLDDALAICSSFSHVSLDLLVIEAMLTLAMEKKRDAPLHPSLQSLLSPEVPLSLSLSPHNHSQKVSPLLPLSFPSSLLF